MTNEQLAQRLVELNENCDGVLIYGNCFYYEYIENTDYENIVVKQQKVPQTDIDIVYGKIEKEVYYAKY